VKSVAEAFGNGALGVIMTAMGSHGAEGIKAIHRVGGLTIGQDEASCTVYSMPRACAALGLLSHVVPLLEMPAQILQATHYRSVPHHLFRFSDLGPAAAASSNCRTLCNSVSFENGLAKNSSGFAPFNPICSAYPVINKILTNGFSRRSLQASVQPGLTGKNHVRE